MNEGRTRRVALLYPGDHAMRDRADPNESRFAALFEALKSAGIAAESAVYHDAFADEVAAQLMHVAVVLVWCNPIEAGRRRDRLDALLSQVAQAGVQVSAHPGTIGRISTKDVLFATRDLPFGSDVFRVDSLARLQAELPLRLVRGARVLKQHRGHSGIGIGVWRVDSPGDGALDVQHAQRGSTPLLMDMALLQATLAPYFEPSAGGHMLDQAWQPRLAEGMVRAYRVEDCVAGFQGLLQQLETTWVGSFCERVGLPRDRLPPRQGEWEVRPLGFSGDALEWSGSIRCPPPGPTTHQ